MFPGHTCPPRWRVWEPAEEQEADGLWFHAHSAEAAAEQWALNHDPYNDYHIVGGSEAVVMVLKEGDVEPPIALCVTGETVPSYSAHAAKTCPLCSSPSPAVDTLMRNASDNASDERVWVHMHCKLKQARELASVTGMDPRGAP